MREIMIRAWEIVRTMVNGTIREKLGAALKQAWAEAKVEDNRAARNEVIAHFESYNERRYSQPWVATIKEGKYDFSEDIGIYTGDHGNGLEGDLMVWAKYVSTEVIYAYGQKDYRGRKTVIKYAVWTGKEFVECDKAGRIIA